VHLAERRAAARLSHPWKIATLNGMKIAVLGTGVVGTTIASKLVSLAQLQDS